MVLGGIRGPSCQVTADHSSSLPNAAHSHAPLEPDESRLAPPGAPAVLDEPVVHTAGSAVANHSHRMVGGVARTAAGKDVALVVMKWPFGP